MKSIKELRELSAAELDAEILNLRKQQLNLRVKRASGDLEKTHLFGVVRKTIARAKTLLSEKVGKADE